MEKTKASIQKQRRKGREGLPLRYRKLSTPRLTAERRSNAVAKIADHKTINGEPD